MHVCNQGNKLRALRLLRASARNNLDKEVAMGKAMKRSKISLRMDFISAASRTSDKSSFSNVGKCLASSFMVLDVKMEPLLVNRYNHLS
jgi:hypothetical protein